MISIKKYIVLSFTFFLAIIPLIYLKLAPAKNGLTEADVLSTILIIVGLVTFSVLLAVHIISHFTKTQLTFKKTALVFFLTIIIELALQFMIAGFTKYILNLFGIYFVDGIDDTIFFQYVSYFNAFAAGIAYFIVGYLIYFWPAGTKPALILGIIRCAIQIGYVLLSSML